MSIAPKTATLALAGVLSLTLASCGYLTNDDEGGGEGGTLRILVHGNPPVEQVLAQLADQFEQQNPGTTVEVSSVPTNDYQNVRNTRIAAGGVDIVEAVDSGFTARSNPDYVTGVDESPFIQGVQAGNWVELTGQEFLGNFSPEVMEQLAYDGRAFLVPTGTVYYTGILYNQDIFAEHGLAVPTTWSEFVEVCQTLQEAGITPLSMGGQDLWPVGLLVLALAQSMFPDLPALDEQLWTGQFPLDGPESVELLEKLQTLYGFTEDNFPGIAYSTIPSRFASGEVAMIPDGNWSAPSIDAAGPEFSYDIFPLPGSDNPADNQYIGGKLDAGYGIPTSSPNQDLAIRFLEFYSQPENYQTFIRGSGFGPVQPGMQTDTPILESIAGYNGDGAFYPAWDQVFHRNPNAGDLLAITWSYQQLAPMGTTDDPAEVAAEMQRTWETALAGN
jgi:raffinose/stachyose/melibiose transport system substrate-binding protein